MQIRKTLQMQNIYELQKMSDKTLKMPFYKFTFKVKFKSAQN